MTISTPKEHTSYFRVENIRHDDGLVRFYTGFVSYEVLLAFFDFLEPVVENLEYWGSATCTSRSRKRQRILTPINQLFLTLVKLQRNLMLKDLAFRFGMSSAQVSRYITTWISFLYHHLKEINWMPTIEQVQGTLPPSFKEKYPKTYAIINGSEIFIETPSDLFLPSSSWSEYKHHNTTKFLLACTPNGAVCFISPLYISDVQLTKTSGFLTQLEGKPDIQIIGDKGFTMKDILKKLDIELNIPLSWKVGNCLLRL